jgi:hypothetical protein
MTLNTLLPRQQVAGAGCKNRSDCDREDKMALNAKWAPMNWPCGPMEVARLSASSGSAELRKTAAAWALPSTLQLLKDTPFNCLVVDWASGGDEDEAQQKALQPLIDAGRALGLSYVGRVTAKASQAAAVAAAHRAGLEAVILEGPVSHTFEPPAIVTCPRYSMDWNGATDIFCATGNVWPGGNLPTMRGDTALGGPTGNPWVNSNGWFALLSQKLAAGKSLWLDIDLPGGALGAEDYCLAIADSRVFGAHWVLSLDGNLRRGLLNADAQATSAWHRITETVSFFERHPNWQAYQPMGVLGVVSDFRNPKAYKGGEVLNLLNRRQIQFVILDRADALSTQLTGLKAILWVDEEPPSTEQHRELLAFVEQGGLVMAPGYWGPPGLSSHTEDWLFDYVIYDLGKGRIAVASGGFTDPYQLARNAHVLMGRENDVARLYNTGTTAYYYTSIDPERRRVLVQIVNYAVRPAEYVALWVNSKARQGRLWSPDAHPPAPLTGIAAGSGTQFDLPTFAVNCGVEFERAV